MRIAVIGSEGYLGSALVPRLKCQSGAEMLRIDAGLWGDPAPGVVVCSEREQIKRTLMDWDPECVVYLAALAHDIHGKIDRQKIRINNADLPYTVASWCANRGHRFIGVSSYSIYSACGAYPLSKQLLEDFLCQVGLRHNVSMVRLATLFGVTPNTTVHNFRPHLLINSFMIDAMNEGKIFVDDIPRMRPVLPLPMAVGKLCELVNDPVGGVLHNLHVCSGSLMALARAVADFTGAKIEQRAAPVQDNRDYGFPLHISEVPIDFYLHSLKLFVEVHLKELVEKRRTCWDDYYQRVAEMKL